MNRLLVCLIFITISVLKADILYSQIPDTLNGTNMACQLDSTYPFDFEVVDDIVVTGEGWDIDTIITWWWNWHGFSTWDLVPNIHFLVYPDSGSTYGPKDSSYIDIPVEQANYEVYEYVTGERWRVEMALSFIWPTVLSPGRWWIEIQPSNVFYDNGQTGIVAEVGCGNGFEAWCRYATISHYYWGPATYWFGAPYEMGFIFLGRQITSIQEKENLEVKHKTIATIVSGSLLIFPYNEYSVFDITGRQIYTLNPAPGIYFIEVDGEIRQKVIKIK